MIAPPTRDLAASVARVVLVGAARQPRRSARRVCRDPEPLPRRSRESAVARSRRAASRSAALEFFNGLGGFRPTGGGIRDDPRRANRRRRPGSTSSPTRFRLSGVGRRRRLTWSVNSRENQLTPWSNDPVSDRPGEVFYLRDDDTGDLWSPTALPIRDHRGAYVARHGWGYSRFEHTAHGIAARSAAVRAARRSDQDLAPDAAQPFGPHAASVGDRLCGMGAGPSRTASLPFVDTEIDPETGAMFARNPWNAAFRLARRLRRHARPQTDWTGDRGSSSAATARWRTRPRCSPRRAVQTRRRRPRSLRRVANEFSCCRAGHRDRVLPRRAASARRRGD
jgi:cyclic beta-1,2-glucan synthetase